MRQAIDKDAFEILSDASLLPHLDSSAVVPLMTLERRLFTQRRPDAVRLELEARCIVAYAQAFVEDEDDVLFGLEYSCFLHVLTASPEAHETILLEKQLMLERLTRLRQA